MRLAMLALCAYAVVGCGKKQQQTNTGSGGSANAGSAAPATGSGGLAFDPPEADASLDAVPLAFDGKIPRLPAISPDGTELADFDSPATGPMIPLPMNVVIRTVGGDTVRETLTVFTFEEASAIAEVGSAGSNWQTPALMKTLKARGAAVLARLRGFRSLEHVKMDEASGGEAKLTKLGDLVLDPGGDSDESIAVELRDAHGGVLQRAELESYSTGSAENTCGYRPSFRDAFRDGPTRMLYVLVGYHYRDDCDPPKLNVFGWSLDPAKASPEAALHTLVTRQFDIVGVTSTNASDIAVPAAPIVSANMIGSIDDVHLVGVAMRAMDYSGSSPTNVQVTISRDGKSAWASELASIALLETNTPGRDAPWRASDVLVKTAQGWRLAALAWTEPRGNAEANRDAKAGKLAANKLTDDPGDAGLREAFAKLASDGVDATAAARADLVAIGSGPSERTVGGAGFARAWNAAWKGKVTIVSSIARVLPSGTTGWVAATIQLAKPGYKIPFTVFAVFDKTADGNWSLVHVHFAV